MYEAAYRWLTTGPPAFAIRPVLIQVEPLLTRPPYNGPVPHLVKQRILRHYARRFRLRSLVETGTYMGDMVWAMRRQFDEIYSVELDAKLHARAVERFKSNPHIHLYQGDSAKVLGDVIPRLNGPSLFWLDGHYSAGVTAKGESETPVMSEIGHVLDDSRWAHVILVDDARCFGQGEYPAVDDLRTLIATRRDLALEVTEDVIRILPKQ